MQLIYQYMMQRWAFESKHVTYNQIKVIHALIKVWNIRETQLLLKSKRDEIIIISYVFTSLN